ncbi:hypothetical protein ACTOB_003931 [Actinoplanes oblitus]|uniref:PBS lyase n=1 Tax=Actinoplanes oblitus TaxID=3040509 RepID=A0ABY8WQS0_9ACTN|nr:hypothetical protein [Actinoplanes oblitus]WIN00237.1 hypothetical protein ACTOB_003931 [Actinoplanes oblitus]
MSKLAAMLGETISTLPGPQRVDRVRDLLAAGADDVLARELTARAADNNDSWRWDDAMVLRQLDDLPAGRRHALILRVADSAAAAGRSPAQVGAVLCSLARGLEPDDVSGPAAQHLIEAAAVRMTDVPRQLDLLATVAERETGTVPAGLIAVMRRTVHHRHDPALLLPWIAKADGLLNVGEVWAETADGDPGARRMLAHALRAQGARPAATWTRESRELARELDAAGPWRRRIHHWFALVPRPRTIEFRGVDLFDATELLDAYNVVALRGLMFLLAVTRPAPGDPAAIGALAEYAAVKVPGHGPRDAKVANAAVLSLELIGTTEALDELERLRTVPLQPGLASRVEAAAARRRVAHGR